MQDLQYEISRRRTFAIISHPDAGKTTLTEKLLLYGGAIRLAGSVKARKSSRHAVSDWMEIEKQRGISVTSSVMQFEYDGYCINILDTPGHQDFSEDTYRTLMAADSAVMLIDGAKGVEEQTIKLFHVCKMRGIPIFTFVNKMDRASKDPFALMEEIEKVLGIRCCPVNWPVGTEGNFQGVYDRRQSRILLYEAGGSHGRSMVASSTGSTEDPAFASLLGEYLYRRLKDEVELLDLAGDNMDMAQVLSGQLSPMFFGSAMNNFGVEPFLADFLTQAPCPGPRMAGERLIRPEDGIFSGFIFKIQANMNPAHRDRLAFLRICSGKFEKGMTVWHERQGKEIRLAQPQQFMARERESVETAWPGDIIGLFDPGIFNIGDTLSAGDKTLKYKDIPIFPAEHFARVSPMDSMKRKQFLKGILQLSEEGAIQVFRQPGSGTETLVIGAVGLLQFDVLSHRLRSEYSVDLRLQQLNYRFARWLPSAWSFHDPRAQDPRGLNLTSSSLLVEDRTGQCVILFENTWSITWALDKNKGLVLSDITGI